jgi:tetratricopeptide (TPR) repeat protein
VRRYADGKHLSKLKIVAGILGVRLDELRQRDAQRRLRRRLFYGAASLVLASLVAWLVYSEASTRQAAQVQRANTEELLSFMLGDLQRLDPIAGLEDFTYEDMEHALYADQLGFSSLDSEALMSRAIEWREAGNELNWKGKTDAAMEKHMQSRAAIIEVYRRDGKTPRVIFELGQAEFYVGEVYIQKGQLERTRQHWSYYGALTRRLLNAEPKNPVYVMELAYTLLNLGALEQMFAVPDNQKSLTLLQAAVQYSQMALVLDPGNAEYESSLASALEWQSDAWMQVCSLGNALEGRLETESVRRKLLAADPDGINARIDLAYTLSGLSVVQQDIGLNENAVESLREAVAILKTVHGDEPDNESIEWESLYREARLARILTAVGELEQAREIFLRLAGRIGELSRDGELGDQSRVVEARFFDLDQARVMMASGQVEQGEALLRDTVARITDMVRKNPDFRRSLVALVYASFFYWEQFGVQPPGSPELLATLYPEDFKAEACTDADRAARIAVMEGDREKARRMTDYAVGKGYFEAEFIRFCRQYGLCELP